jgi:hypothetical protein
MDDAATVRAIAQGAANLVSHRFDLIDTLQDGSRIPIEALSEDHSIGIYGAVAPRKMRNQLHGYAEADLSAFRPGRELQATPFGVDYQEFLEYVPLRGVRFRAEELQYLEEGWDATLAEVKYPMYTTLALLHLVGEAFGSAHLYLNRTLPMPLWIRTEPIESESVRAQIAIQVTAAGRMRPTNIHTECSMEYARQWVSAARLYYDIPASDAAAGSA